MYILFFINLLLLYHITADEPRDTGGVDIQDYQIQIDAGNGNYYFSLFCNGTMSLQLKAESVDD